MNPTVDSWITWWTSLTPEQKRAERERAARRRAYWMRRRVRVLFGLRPRCVICDHLWGAYEDSCHCDDGKCHNPDACKSEVRE